MSLNRSEQLVFDYLQAHPDERQHWMGKVQRIAAGAADLHEGAHRLEADLWRYFEERSAVAAPFRDIALREGVRRTSLKNLAEYLLRLWVAPRPKKPAPPA